MEETFSIDGDAFAFVSHKHKIFEVISTANEYKEVIDVLKKRFSVYLQYGDVVMHSELGKGKIYMFDNNGVSCYVDFRDAEGQLVGYWVLKDNLTKVFDV
jgi:hypothetical protein